MSVEPRARRSLEVTTPEIAAIIHKIILEDRRLKQLEISETANVSKECTSCI